MPGLSNTYLNMVGYLMCPNFQGVFPCDIIPTSRLSSTFAIILNMAKSTEPHGHFISVVRDQDSLYVFDPLNLPIVDVNVEHFIDSLSVKHVKRNQKAVQHPASEACGYFCIAMIIYFSKYKSMDTFVNTFIQPPSLHNDVIAMEQILCTMNKVL